LEGRHDIQNLALFLVMETALSLSPGPGVFYVVSQGVRGALRRSLPRGRRHHQRETRFISRCRRLVSCDHRRQRAFFYDCQMGGLRRT